MLNCTSIKVRQFLMKTIYKLKNYLRRHRKASGLSQEDLAFLLGCREGSKVSRYEHFSRQPSLRTALACESIFEVTVRELFAGPFDEVRRRSRTRANLLIQQLPTLNSDRRMTQRIRTLRRIAADNVA